jgi:hypothetical protein
MMFPAFWIQNSLIIAIRDYGNSGEKSYKNSKINGEIQQPADTIHTNYTSLRLQFRNFLGNSDHPENNDCRRRRPNSIQIQDELD